MELEPENRLEEQSYHVEELENLPEDEDEELIWNSIDPAVGNGLQESFLVFLLEDFRSQSCFLY